MHRHTQTCKCACEHTCIDTCLRAHTHTRTCANPQPPSLMISFTDLNYFFYLNAYCGTVVWGCSLPYQRTRRPLPLSLCVLQWCSRGEGGGFHPPSCTHRRAPLQCCRPLSWKQGKARSPRYSTRLRALKVCGKAWSSPWVTQIPAETMHPFRNDWHCLNSLLYCSLFLHVYWIAFQQI